MIDEKELIDKMEKEKINCFCVTSPKELDRDHMIYLENNDIDEFINFVKLNNINSVFYKYYTFNPEYFYINEELAEDIDDDVINLLKNDIEKWNRKIDKVNFDIPVELVIFCMYESHYITINYHNEFWDNQMSAKEKLVELLEGNAKKVKDIREKMESEKEELKEKLKEYILNDDEFKICTNKNLRKNYMYKLYKRKDIEKFKNLFWQQGGYFRGTDAAINFIELVWRTYKQNQRKNIETLIQEKNI